MKAINDGLNAARGMMLGFLISIPLDTLIVMAILYCCRK